MSYLQTGNQLPGIIGLLAFAPHTAKSLGELAEALLRAPSSLSPAEREMIAGHVSYLNDCYFCSQSHAAFASYYSKDKALVEEVRIKGPGASVSPKLKALLSIAAKVQKSGKEVRAEDVAQARNAGATEKEIHDTVLIAAAFCMFNRYVDGLGTFAPKEEAAYDQMAEQICSSGYGI